MPTFYEAGKQKSAKYKRAAVGPGGMDACYLDPAMSAGVEGKIANFLRTSLD
jgi:hypothetical protein